MKIRNHPGSWWSAYSPRGLSIVLLLVLLCSACQPGVAGFSFGDTDGLTGGSMTLETEPASQDPSVVDTSTPPYPSRPRYSPGELVDYVAQSGDTLPFLAWRFNTSVDAILEANSFIPSSATTMPPGMPMKIPIYYLPLWGSPYRILPDSYFVNGPLQVGFETGQFVAAQSGWLSDYSSFVADENRTGAEIVDYVAHYWSISPRLLLALLEYQSGALTQPRPDAESEDYPLGSRHWSRKGLFLQLAWAANQLNGAYYSYKTMQLSRIEHRDGRITRFDPWQNAATVSLHTFFNEIYEYDDFLSAISPEGFAHTYTTLFGDPWQDEQPHIAGSLEQPDFILPFEPGDVWALTGGPHTGWGVGEPLAALDFAPPSKSAGCIKSGVWATAVSAGVVVRSTTGEVMLDLDGDGDERTGWNVFYLHVGTQGRVPLGAILEQGDPIGHPSCEGGSSTGTHIHIARKYNGEWIPAAGMGGVMPFMLEGWLAHNGVRVYLGTLTRGSRTVTSCTCSNAASFIRSDRPEPQQ